MGQAVCDAARKFATRHATSLQTPRCLHDHAGITTGNEGLDRMRGGGRDGRGNLRENREDPAPTVGIAIRIAPKGRPLPPPCAYHATPHPPMSPWFYNDAAPKSRRGTPRRYKRRRPPSSSPWPGVDVHPQAAVAHPDDGRFPSPLGRQVGQPPRHRETGDRRRGCL